MKAHKALLLSLPVTLAPSLAFAGGGGDWSLVIYQGVNLAILVSAIIYFAGSKVSAALTARADQLSAEIKEAEQLQHAAQEQLDALQTQLDDFQEERAALIARYKTQGEAERDRLIAEGTKEAERLRAEAKRLSANALQSAREKIERELIEGALERAQTLLTKETNEADQLRLGETFTQELKAQR